MTTAMAHRCMCDRYRIREPTSRILQQAVIVFLAVSKHLSICVWRTEFLNSDQIILDRALIPVRSPAWFIGYSSQGNMNEVTDQVVFAGTRHLMFRLHGKVNIMPVFQTAPCLHSTVSSLAMRNTLRFYARWRSSECVLLPNLMLLWRNGSSTAAGRQCRIRSQVSCS